MASDEENEDELGMTEEQQGTLTGSWYRIDAYVLSLTSRFCSAQMALSLSVAKPLLADLKPPVTDEAIQESLWYYFFDVEKTVNYIKAQRAKG
jgi:hypothetical protein